MITSICKAYYQYILVQGVLFGLGVGMVCVAMTLLVCISLC